MLNSIVLGHEIIMFRGGGHADSNRNCDDRLLNTLADLPTTLYLYNNNFLQAIVS